MTRVIFYSNLADKNTTLLNLLQRALEKRNQVTILTESEDAASQLNTALWQANACSFYPNVLSNHALARNTPVLIDWQEKNLFQDDILINLTQHQLTAFSRFRQLVELVSKDEVDKTAARQRFKFYRDRGYEIKHIEQTNVTH
ncbi:MAG: DNA polymerase III subunit chi [Methylophilaceae bacterium]